MAYYNVVLKYANGTMVELFPKSYSFIDELNKESTAKVSVSFEEVKLLADKYQTTVASIFTPAAREIYIERNGTKIFNGVVTNYEITPDAQGGKTLNLDAVDWFGLLGKRFVGFPSTVYTATDAADIAWDLISDTQASDGSYSNLGITRGTHPTTKSRDRTYKFDNIKDSIIRLSNSNLKDGFDFSMSTTKVFDIYYPTRGNTLDSLVFDERNLANWRYKLPLLLTETNKVYVLGDGQNDDVLYVTRTGTVTNRTNWYTQEGLLRETDVKETTTLNDKGDKHLALYETPAAQFSFEHYDDLVKWEDYALGDKIRVDIQDIGLTYVQFRVIKREFSMDSTKSIAYIKVSVL
jgi:hypothetical protein